MKPTFGITSDEIVRMIRTRLISTLSNQSVKMKIFLPLSLLVLLSCSSLRYGGPTGAFHGLLPCADCPGITTTLTLNADQTYTLEQRYMDREIESTGTQGTFQYKRGGQIILSGDIAGMQRLQVTGESLTLVDSLGRLVATEFPDRYVLRRQAPEEVIFTNEDAVFFRATGNEPFWMVEIDPDGTMHLKALGPEELDLTFTLTSQDPAEAGVSYTYTGTSDEGSLTVTSKVIPCSDDMSGENRTHTVSAELLRKDQQSPLIFKGCGSHPSPFRMHDIWRLTSLNGEPIEAESQGLYPYLIFNALDGTATGSGGCNRINGTFLLRGSTITFGEFISTKRACPILDLEGRFMAAMSGHSFQVEADDELTMTGKEMILVFSPQR